MCGIATVLKFVVSPRYVGKVWIKRRSLLEGLWKGDSKLLRKKALPPLQHIGFFFLARTAQFWDMFQNTCWDWEEHVSRRSSLGLLQSLLSFPRFACIRDARLSAVRLLIIAITLSGYCDVMMSQGHLMTAVSKNWPLPSVQWILHFPFGGYLHGKKNTKEKKVSLLNIKLSRNCHFGHLDHVY